MDDNYYFSLKTRFSPGLSSEQSPASPTLWFIFFGEKLLVESSALESSTICTRSPEQLGLSPGYSQFLGLYGETNCFVAEIESHTKLPSSTELHGLRALFGRVENDLFTLAGRAQQILHYHKEHQFCGKCGTPMKNRKTELAKICPACGFISFPRLSPAVIMSVTRDDQILLGRAPHFPKGMYSTLAGFVEPGETLEEAVRREVMEETAIEINNIKYQASQPWPFPHSIMLGFSASYIAGEIFIDHNELEDARWFSVKKLPSLPSKITIARLLIDNFIKSCS